MVRWYRREFKGVGGRCGELTIGGLGTGEDMSFACLSRLVLSIFENRLFSRPPQQATMKLPLLEILALHKRHLDHDGISRFPSHHNFHFCSGFMHSFENIAHCDVLFQSGTRAARGDFSNGSGEVG